MVGAEALSSTRVDIDTSGHDTLPHMPTTSVHVAEHIARPAVEVYQYVSDPANLAHWASGLGNGVEQVDGEWQLDTPGGRATVEFAPQNPHGVLDHRITLPEGVVIEVPMRVLEHGPDDAEVVFTVRPLAGMSDEDLAQDVAVVTEDLQRLKAVLEGQPVS
ncbi:polyketide cyclase/dehydrase/lipid transport protein [Motilibacter rhizosphaerae]|uniref:Polyketide cyclase/dehydrase/lipid transport protein n=2 Tax=Motilibacter rhizosphaerae TaxID=598652 RepID=A0A4Q7NBA5_9ACTN|nr:polyketide cyclase/dehydrase/lipid transport protein [Motilibacter rhizosphaerae]